MEDRAAAKDGAGPVVLLALVTRLLYRHLKEMMVVLVILTKQHLQVAAVAAALVQ